MSYKKQFSKYEVNIGCNTYGWFKDYDKAVDKFNFYAKYPDELDDTLVLKDSKTGEILMSCEPEE